MKKIKVDKSIGVIIHIYMEISQANSLCSYLYLKTHLLYQSKIYLFPATFCPPENLFPPIPSNLKLASDIFVI
jgi:hypothetical protein